MLNDEIECPYCGEMQDVIDDRDYGHVLLECDEESGGCGGTFFVRFASYASGTRINRIYVIKEKMDV